MNAVLRQVLRWGKISLGFLLILIGVIAGFIPVIQGWMFVLPGLAILATEFVWAKRIESWVKTKFKSALAKVQRKRQAPVADDQG